MRTDPLCRRTVLALPWLLNGTLAPVERREVREHLIACPACRAELGRTREALAVFGAARAASDTATAPARGVLAHRRPALGRTTLRRLAWAAAVGAVVASGASLWLAVGGGERSTVAQRSTPPPAREQLAAREVPLSPSPSTRAPAVQPAVPAPAVASAAAAEANALPATPATAPRPRRSASVPTEPAAPADVTFAMTFETGSLAAPERLGDPAPQADSQLSAIDFEGGALGVVLSGDGPSL